MKETHSAPQPLTQTLDTLIPGQRCAVTQITTKNAELRNRLLSMGIVENTSIAVERIAPLGCPMKICALGYALSLRKSEAAEIEVLV